MGRKGGKASMEQRTPDQREEFARQGGIAGGAARAKALTKVERSAIAKEVVGERDPRQHEFSIQMRAMDADKSGVGLGLPVLVALCGSLLGKNTRGGTIIVGSLNLGGSIDMIPNAIRIAELAIDKQAQTLLMPVSARRQLNDLPDDLWTRISIEFYKDGADAVFKALVE